jgi:ribulose 1,5-bisphosphate synthetase/thiazole synthase
MTFSYSEFLSLLFCKNITNRCILFFKHPENRSKSIAIMGGGIAGLTAGIYARMNGFETEIYEMHTNARGRCTE